MTRMHVTVPATARLAEVHSLKTSAVAEVGDLLVFSGMVYFDQETGQLPENVPFGETALLLLRQLGNALGDLGLSFDHVVKVTAYMSDMSNYPEWDQVWNETFTAPYPARTSVAVTLASTSLLELDVIACKQPRYDAAEGE